VSPARTSRVAWLPGSDRLRGECSCGATTEAGDPIGLWRWLLAHPDHPATAPEPTVSEPGASEPGVVVGHTPPAHRVHHPAQAAGARVAVR